MNHVAEPLRTARAVLSRPGRWSILARSLRAWRLVIPSYEYHPVGWLGYLESSLLRWLSATAWPGLRETRQLNKVDHLRIVPLRLAEPDNAGHMNVVLEPGMANPLAEAASRASPVTIGCLDNVCEYLSEGDARVDGIKVDVQGMELHALQGMRSTLMAHRPLLGLELHAEVDRDAVVSLTEYDYRLPGIPLTRSSEGGGQYLDDHTYVFSSTLGMRDAR